MSIAQSKNAKSAVLEVSTTATPAVSEIQDGLSPMALTFIVTGVLCGITVILGITYALLYHTQMSLSSRRKLERQRTHQGAGRSNGSAEPRRRTNAHITLFGLFASKSRRETRVISGHQNV